MNVTVTVHIKNLHVHIVGPAAPEDEVEAALPQLDLGNIAAGLGRRSEDVQVAVNKLRSTPAEASTPAPAAEPTPAAAGTVIQLPPTRRRRKSALAGDGMDDLIEQARQMAVGAALPVGEGPEPSPAADSEPAAGDEPQPETDPNAVLFKPTTGVVVEPVAPNAPELTVIRDGLRALGYSDTVKAMGFLGELVGRPITRLGELDAEDVRDVVAHLTANGAVR